MAELLKQSSTPVVAVPASATVLETTRLMDRREIGAVIVEEQGTMVGIFSERDLLRRVVAPGRNPASTRVAEVMSTPVLSASAEADTGEAVDAMMTRHIRHVPVVDRMGKPVGMLSFRGAMSQRIDELQHEIDVLGAYLGYDGVSG